LIRFLSDIKAGKHHVEAPVYSHLVYDVVKGEKSPSIGLIFSLLKA